MKQDAQRARIEAAFREFARFEREEPGLRPRAFVERHPADIRESLLLVIEDYLRLREGSEGAGPAPGETREFGEFQLLRELGRGASGIVWEAYQESLGRRVALKILHPLFVLSDRVHDRFRLEAGAAARLSHPGIVGIFSVGDELGTPFIAQELIPCGRTLADWIAERRQSGDLSREHHEEAARLAAGVAEALAHAHERGIIHRDLKPSNVLLTPEGEPKVADFGLARVDGEPSLSKSGDLTGTIAYMAPEQVLGKRREVDARCDVFSLGVTLYELLTCTRPFEGDTQQQVIEKILREDPADPRTLRSRIPRDLALVCLKALRKKPAERYATMAAFAADLRAFLRGAPVAARPPAAYQRTLRFLRRYPKSSAATVAAGVLLAATLLTLAWVKGERDVARFEAELSSSLLALTDELDLARDGSGGSLVLARLLGEARGVETGAGLTSVIEKIAGSHRQQGHTHEAIGLFEEALARHREEGTAGGDEALDTRRRLGWCYLLEMSFEPAAATLERGLELAPAGSLRHDILEAGYVEVLIRGRLEERLLAYLRDAGDPEGRLRDLVARLREERPRDELLSVQIQATLGAYLRFQKRYGEAEEVLEDCELYCQRTLPPGDPLSLQILVEKSLARGEGQRSPRQWRDSAEDFRRAAAGLAERFGLRHPAVGRAWFEAGRADLEAHDWAAAEADYSRAQGIFDALGEGHLYSLLIRQHRLTLESFGPGQPVSVPGSHERCLEQARELQADFAESLGPSHSDALNALRLISVIHHFGGERTAEADVLKRALAANPGERWLLGPAREEALEAKTALMGLAFARGRDEQGLSLGRHLLEELRDDPWSGRRFQPLEHNCLIQTAYWQLEEGQIDAATATLSEIRGPSPNLPTDLWLRAMRSYCLASGGLFDEGRDELHTVIEGIADLESDPGELQLDLWPPGLLFAAEAARLLGDRESAARVLEKLRAPAREDRPDPRAAHFYTDSERRRSERLRAWLDGAQPAPPTPETKSGPGR